MYAVVNTGGKQAKVEVGTVIAVDKLKAKVGDTVSLPTSRPSAGLFEEGERRRLPALSMLSSCRIAACCCLIRSMRACRSPRKRSTGCWPFSSR